MDKFERLLKQFELLMSKLRFAQRVSGHSTVVAKAIASAALVLSFTGNAASAQSPSVVRFASSDGTNLQGYLLRPPGGGQHPAVIALHGCGGPLNRKRSRLVKRHRAWGRTLARNGYVVLFPDSFGSRGYRALCRVKPRPVKHRDRQRDVAGAQRWLAGQTYVSANRISVLGWSNGGSTALRVASSKIGRKLHSVIAFYPGCRAMLRKLKRRPTAPLKIIMGAADDWTPPEPCVQLAKRWGIQIVLYEGAYHGFDTPRSKVRRLHGMAYSKDGTGSVTVGTHPGARKKAIDEVLRTLR